MKKILFVLMSCACLVTSCAAPSQPAARSDKELRLLSYNVLVGFERSEAKKTAFVNWVRPLDPDIIVYQELNFFTEARLLELAQRVGHAHAVLLKEKGYPVGISSRYPITEVKKVLTGMVHGYLSARIGNWQVFAIHLSPRKVEERISEMNLVMAAVDALPARSKVLLAGDFNSFSLRDQQVYGETFKADMLRWKPNAPVDFTTTQTVLDRGYRDAFAMFHHDFQRSAPTRRFQEPGNRGRRYDYVFLSPALAKDCLAADIIQDELTDTLSDHYPVFLKFKK